MQPVAAELAPDAIDKLAAYYSSLAAPAQSVTTAVPTNELATAGNPAAGIPACTGCHDSKALAAYPRLAGQNAAYMANRLGLWKKGLPPSTDGEAIMAPIARLLNEQQIAELSAYFAALSPEREPGPRP
jgi:cytochrome c553